MPGPLLSDPNPFAKAAMISVVGYTSPVGRLLLGAFGDEICLCDWITDNRCERSVHRLRRALNADVEERLTPTLQTCISELDEYFSKNRTGFDLPVLLVGTDFQRRVWSALLTIPFGTTISYGALASRIGSPSSVRAVANAVGANPISILVPCHRVIGADGSLIGYAGGLAAKRRLLKLEIDTMSDAVV